MIVAATTQRAGDSQILSLSLPLPLSKPLARTSSVPSNSPALACDDRGPSRMVGRSICAAIALAERGEMFETPTFFFFLQRARRPRQRRFSFFPLGLSSSHLLFSSPFFPFPSNQKHRKNNSLASCLQQQRSYAAATTLSTSSSPNYFPHLSKSSTQASPSVSQARVAGATLRGRDRAPRTSMSDPETVYAKRASGSNAPPTQPLTSAGTIDPRFSYAFRHHSMSDAASQRGPVAPGVHVFEGGPAVSTADVASPLRHSMAEPEFASAVRTRLS